MEKLLAALAAFSENPATIGDNLFSFFKVITSMEWEDALAAGCAINTLKTEAWNKAVSAAKAEGKGSAMALEDKTYARLETCMSPVVARIGQILFEAPKERQSGLFQAVKAARIIRADTLSSWARSLDMKNV